ncbi:beta-amyrin 11-oxidase-like [Tripterygium wilfordii]|uniref:beta-amyrin 11-oxidase-like n=1 Tax=Tripterygium wilfordii TaxID=458696 RepID=UPI0018F842CF|nr:beta-amyrin 11-oxidase-like [Tripterygium wilfordii]
MNKDGKSKEKSSMLDFLLEVEDEDGEKFDNESIIDLLAGIVFAGHESSAFATMWVLLYLRQNPQVAQKVKEEQEEIVNNRPPTQKGLSMKEIKQMNYTVKAVNETLRKANLGFGVFREATEDTEINGYAIPKGWKILVMQRHIHMDSQIHPNPKAYDPSRFDNPKAAGTFFPFALGVRTCPGSDFARLQIYIFVHYFYLNYKIEVINPDCKINYFPIPLPKDNCLAKIIKLSSDFLKSICKIFSPVIPVAEVYVQNLMCMWSSSPAH